jgi:hypothetical protein
MKIEKGAALVPRKRSVSRWSQEFLEAADSRFRKSKNQGESQTMVDRTHAQVGTKNHVELGTRLVIRFVAEQMEREKTRESGHS